MNNIDDIICFLEGELKEAFDNFKQSILDQDGVEYFDPDEALKSVSEAALRLSQAVELRNWTKDAE
jgi:hypothetical protein